MSRAHNTSTLPRRRLLQGVLIGAGAALLTSCTPASPRPIPRPKESNMTTPPPSRSLLAYFSRAGENYFNGRRIDLTTGNTKVAAGMIADLINADTYEILAADPYPDEYPATVERNVQEERDNARPAIADPLPDLTRYDTILLGSPVWNVQAPMIMRTFIETVDLAHKTIHPFVTYAVSGMGRVRDDYAQMLPDTTVTDGLAIRGETVNNSRADIQQWLEQIRLR